MSTCATCKYFAAPRDRGGEDASGMGISRYDYANERMVPKNNWHTCVRIIHGNTHGEPMHADPKLLAVVCDGSGDAARLAVRPDFGCVLWEEKE